jgi:hypothetical protein
LILASASAVAVGVACGSFAGDTSPTNDAGTDANVQPDAGQLIEAGTDRTCTELAFADDFDRSSAIPVGWSAAENFSTLVDGGPDAATLASNGGTIDRFLDASTSGDASVLFAVVPENRKGLTRVSLTRRGVPWTSNCLRLRYDFRVLSGPGAMLAAAVALQPFAHKGAQATVFVTTSIIGPTVGTRISFVTTAGLDDGGVGTALAAGALEISRDAWYRNTVTVQRRPRQIRGSTPSRSVWSTPSPWCRPRSRPRWGA